jgi:hypothetical protein
MGFPAPREDDHEDVHWALTTAQSLHSQGDNVEALRWVRKAVAAAVACDLDRRAIELGRVAAELEDSFGAATTQRGEGARKGAATAVAESTNNSLARHDFANQPVDDLDSPTYVDSHRPGSVPRGSGPVDPMGAVDSEPTVVPYTQHSAGTQSPPSTQTMTSSDAEAVASTLNLEGRVAAPSGQGAPSAEGRPPSSQFASNHDTFTMPAMVLEDLQRQDAAPNSTLQLEDDDNPTMMSSSSGGSPPKDRTMPAQGDGAVARWRVALLAAPDGDARVMVLGRDDRAPEGAALAMIIPASADDARTTSAGSRPSARSGLPPPRPPVLAASSFRKAPQSKVLSGPRTSTTWVP